MNTLIKVMNNYLPIIPVICNKIHTGVYQHYKNKKFYYVTGISKHTEKNENLVVYRPMYKCDYKMFCRPEDMFKSKVFNTEGKEVSRFKLIEKGKN